MSPLPPVLTSSLRTFYQYRRRKEVDFKQWRVGDYCVTRTVEHGWVRAVITGLEEGEEYAELCLSDLGIPYRAPRRLLKPLAEKFSLKPQYSFRLVVVMSGAGTPSSLSEDCKSALMRRLQELMEKAEKGVVVEVGILQYCTGFLLVVRKPEVRSEPEGTFLKIFV